MGRNRLYDAGEATFTSRFKAAYDDIEELGRIWKEREQWAINMQLRHGMKEYNGSWWGLLFLPLVPLFYI